MQNGGFENKFTKWMSSKSWGLYLFHCTYISIIKPNTVYKMLADIFEVSLDDLVNYDSKDSTLLIPPKGKHMFGTVKVGDKGQIVIPAQARKIFDINPGDNLVILGDEEQGIAMIKEEGILELINQIRG